ncbi:UV damage endonuclease UvsE [Paenibacillus baekrokdamisoli]|uniref:UV damage endonuclease UvsE n=1 Tax=Paenibacillus baekrokdamisoli TaxID=1712516 RepID=A0A3G9JI58_9BACL|nr:UV DNA damage repair endonuclease UvsE [Paenibacillus baekrokdamisoli]MBB3068274.1 UV DNA damage endonuclease [Paenibacillus baekrokdamisoli]BBH22684.1 UV damage endonuclease UvsE [Paenibacillus baekrokdamisoli]
MIVRFGFVAMSMRLTNASPSHTMTFATFSKLNDREAALRKLERTAEDNLKNTLRLLRHCYTHDIRMYRFSSKLIPLATHDELKEWLPWSYLQEAFADIGRFVREKQMRVSFHPDHFCVFSTPRPEVLAKSKDVLAYHLQMLEAMGLDEEAKCNIHVGGAYGDKPTSAERFIKQFSELDDKFKRRITLENDDKTFTARETLAAAEAVGTPMVLDIHHHAVNDGGETDTTLFGDLWPRILRTWQTGDYDKDGRHAAPGRLAEGANFLLPTKIHVSSPKSEKDPRCHADNVEVAPLFRFLKEAAGSVDRLDCMLEAKQKDAALFKLMDDFRELEAAGESIRVIDGASIEI